MSFLKQLSSLPGYLSAIGAFAFWGLIPLYWREVAEHSAFELIGHRVLWGSLSLFLYLRLYKGISLSGLCSKVLKWSNSWLLLSSFLIAVNWFTFMYAVIQDKVVEASLGYFLNPLINVFLGLILFKEKVGRLKWVSIGLAFTGLTVFSLGKLSSPGISLLLACTFACYGVLHKRSQLDPIEALLVETTIVAIVLMPYLIYSNSFSLSFFKSRDVAWLLSAGPVTVFPLLLFTFAVKRSPFSSVGIIQYLAPLGQFTLGVSVFGQKLEAQAVVAFGLIWLALGLFSFGEYTMLKHQGRILDDKGSSK
jgi:chloramphenicol-sensitive protein RarD